MRQGTQSTNIEEEVTRRIAANIAKAAGFGEAAAVLTRGSYMDRHHYSQELPRMDIYNHTKVDTTMDGKRGVLLQGFNIIGAHGRPLVPLSFENQAEAEAAHEATRLLSERPS